MEDSSLTLDGVTLKNLLRETYKSDHPINSITSILSYYDVTLEQLQSVCGSLFHAHQAVEDGHPLKSIVQDILDILNPNTKTSPQAYKIDLVYVATSITHIWCKEFTPVVMLDPKESTILSYSSGNTPVGFVWLHFNKKGMPVVLQHSPDAPSLYVDLFMYTDVPEVISFSNEAGTQTSNISIQTEATGIIVTSNESDDMVPISYTSDYVIVITRGNAFYRLSDVILVQPSENKTTKYPASLHKL